jgi:carboxymethylenebutenolidase
MSEGMQAETITIAGHEGDDIEAYVARPMGDDRPSPRGGVVVIHHMPGWDRASKEIVRTFAVYGYDAISPHLFHRYASPGDKPGDAAAAARAAGGPSDPQVMGDLAGAIDHVRALPTSNGKVGIIGYCSGGRQAYLAACLLEVDAAVDCYGGGVVMTPDQLSEARPTSPIDLTPQMRAPLLGLFGKDDRNPDPAMVARMEEELTTHGKTFDFHSYDGAGHAFFSVDRPSYNLEAAKDGWKHIWTWFGQYLGSAG